MVRIPAGRFTMGSSSGKEDEAPIREVRINAFLMDRYEVTQAAYSRYDPINGSHFKGPDRPVEMVRWDDAASYCNKRSQEEGLQPCYDENLVCNFAADGYRLPTEAEWEYACLRRFDDRLQLRSRQPPAFRLRLVRRQRREADAPCRPEETERLGPLRHVRQRCRMVQRRLR